MEQSMVNKGIPVEKAEIKIETLNAVQNWLMKQKLIDDMNALKKKLNPYDPIY